MKTTIFKTITIGESKKSLEKKLKDFNISSYAQELIDKMEISKKQNVDLVVLTPRDLGLTGYPTTTEVFEAAKAQGYELCPADVGPALRVAYTDQPLNEWLSIAMEPITGSDGFPFVFRVARDSDGSWLYARWARPGLEWDLGEQVRVPLPQVP